MPAAQTKKTQILNIHKGVNATALATEYVALYITAPTDADGSGTECSWTGYARQPITTATGWSAITNGTPSSISNANDINFGTVAGLGGTITINGWALYDALSAGHEQDYGTFSPGIVVQNGDTVTIKAGQLVINTQ